ncbi:MAG: hypothetical protein AAF762_06895, partial [Pseudomonadota bacterium]
ASRTKGLIMARTPYLYRLSPRTTLNDLLDDVEVESGGSPEATVLAPINYAMSDVNRPKNFKMFDNVILENKDPTDEVPVNYTFINAATGERFTPVPDSDLASNRLVRALTAEWKPTFDRRLPIWFNPRPNVGITKDTNSDRVERWAADDPTYFMSKSSQGQQPFWSSDKTYISFNGTTQHFDLPVAYEALWGSAFTFMFIGYVDSTATGTQKILDGNQSGTSTSIIGFFANSSSNPGRLSMFLGPGSTLLESPDNAFAAQTYHIFCITFDGTSARQILVDGAVVASDTGGVPFTAADIGGGMKFGRDDNGNSNFFGGRIKDQLLYPSLISNGARQVAEGYLATVEPSIRDRLPSDHPYKTQGPEL